jgi:hypothetical protein
MAKAKSFADKVAKSAMDFHRHCPKCGEAINNIQLVKSVKTANSWRYNEKYVGICKCNAKEAVQ